jgi:N6-adenosine-specific RNA methylase IME4
MEDYACILIDPPWAEKGAGKVKRGADRHYPVMSESDIIRTIIQSPEWRPAKNAHLYLWVTNNHLEEGLRVMKALGFRYITNIAWAKPSFGLGQYFRGQHELCLFGVRGILPSQATPRNVPSLITAPKGIHSKKPDGLYIYIERTSPGPRLEMFARNTREGWMSVGNEVEGAQPRKT